MQLQTWNRTFRITSRRYTGLSQECFIGVETTEKNQKEYNIIRIKGKEVAKRFLEFYTENNKVNNDMEFLTVNDEIYVVFPYYRERSFESELMKGSYSLKERLIIGKNILEKIIFSDEYGDAHPYYLQWDGLVNDSIHVSDSFEITFLHKLNNIECFEQYHISDVYNALEKIFQMLFHQEIKKEVSEFITEFIIFIKKKEYDSYLILYEKYKRVFDECDIEQIENAEPQNLPFRIWAKTKNVLSIGKKIGIVIILVIAIGFTMMSIFNEKKNESKTKEEYRFTFIGDIQIK